MSELIGNLPLYDDLDIPTFSRLLDDNTNSYKFMFMLSLLDLLNNRFFKPFSPISLRDIAVEMLVNAWYPYTVFRLSFGSQDMTGRNLDDLNLGLSQSFSKVTEGNKDVLRDAIKAGKIDGLLTRYVPFRLIRPFFQIPKRLKDHQVNAYIKLVAEEGFESSKPLYKFDENGSAIIVHPSWNSYIQANYQIIRGWISWGWLQYMQKRNPNTPALANKLFPSRERESLAEQTSYWRKILHIRSDFRCIYSGQILTSDNFSLDHYLPWSFVAHNQPWNLTPVPKSVNSSKSDKIPDSIYFDGFVKSQHLGLTTFREVSSEKEWNSHIESFILDLGCSDSRALLDLESLAKQYELKLKPLLALAVSQGFASQWTYK
jgi:hypothetical protein